MKSCLASVKAEVRVANCLPNAAASRIPNRLIDLPALPPANNLA